MMAIRTLPPRVRLMLAFSFRYSVRSLGAPVSPRYRSLVIARPDYYSAPNSATKPRGEGHLHGERQGDPRGDHRPGFRGRVHPHLSELPRRRDVRDLPPVE